MTGKNLTLLLLSLVLWLFCACKNTKTSGAASKGIIRKKMLVAAEIESIQILALPRYGKDGEAWDAYAPFATDPDPFLVILWNESPLYKSETLNNQKYGIAAVFSQNLPHKLSPFDQPLLLEVFDEDGLSSNDNIGFINFNPKEHHGQESILLSQNELMVELKMKWYYE
jgi:hypothetical protein